MVPRADTLTRPYNENLRVAGLAGKERPPFEAAQGGLFGNYFIFRKLESYFAEGADPVAVINTDGIVFYFFRRNVEGMLSVTGLVHAVILAVIISVHAVFLITVRIHQVGRPVGGFLIHAAGFCLNYQKAI